ncbi:DUF881 domain-containing protein [Actinoplanes sp. NPDC049548]|uniref:DUF881 domain-containing protein n=1 Tax=Actinoplanes sp. NPDC049548 TaxID=3155152 RepID=UPI00342F45E7
MTDEKTPEPGETPEAPAADRLPAPDGPTVRLTAPTDAAPPSEAPPTPTVAAPSPADGDATADRDDATADGDEPTVVTAPVVTAPVDVGDKETVRLRKPPAAEPVPEPAVALAGPDPAGDPAAPSPEEAGEAAGRVPEKVSAPWRRLSSAGALIWVLLALFGFTLVVQLRSNDADSGLASARQEDLVRILSDLEARDQRLQQEINGLEESQRQLTSGVAGRQAALAEADKRAEELGLLSGTLPATGPGLKITIDPKGQPLKASAILNAVQELRGAGGEVMELVGNNGVAVRIVASSYFVDADGGVIVDGKQLSGPYTVSVIGVPSTMQTALQIPGGVVASVSQAGGNVTMEQRTAVAVTAVRQPASLQYARPVS